jgi:hypothetical protein
MMSRFEVVLVRNFGGICGNRTPHKTIQEELEVR